MRVLVVGSGAREHALCARLAATEEVFCLGANPGIARVATCIAPGADLVASAVETALSHAIDLVVVGPEAPLVAGISDALGAKNIACFGPSRLAAELEGSKGFSKEFMLRHGVPTARGGVFSRSDDAVRYICSLDTAPVVKASGLAAGKGVFVCDTHEEACVHAVDLLDHGALGDSGRVVVIEERLAGDEVSLHVVCDGERYAVFGAAQDHKRLLDGDRGPNTGGMGAYAPVPMFTAALEAEVCRTVVEPTLAGMRAEGRVFRGVLFVGLMLVNGRPSVLEYNVRFGDPECAVLLSRWKGDLAALLSGAARGQLPVLSEGLNQGAALGVVIASREYPQRSAPAVAITGIADAEAIAGVSVFHGGTALNTSAELVANGGRVLLVTANADDFETASARAYEAVEKVRFEGAQHRTDIGARARLGARQG